MKVPPQPENLAVLSYAEYEQLPFKCDDPRSRAAAGLLLSASMDVQLSAEVDGCRVDVRLERPTEEAIDSFLTKERPGPGKSHLVALYHPAVGLVGAAVVKRMKGESPSVETIVVRQGLPYRDELEILFTSLVNGIHIPNITPHVVPQPSKKELRELEFSTQ